MKEAVATRPPTRGPSGEFKLATWTRTMRRSQLREMLAVVARPGILSFAGGLPAAELFPAVDLAAAFQLVLATDSRALQYCPPCQSLQSHIVRLMEQRGVACTEEQIFITTGAQQAIDVLTRLLLNPGGDLLLEEIVYTGVQQAVAPFQPNIVTVTTDMNTGLDVETVDAALRDGLRPAFLYVIPHAHNPLGVSVAPDKRRLLLETARRYAIPIIEDDPYGFLAYDAVATPALAALDSDSVIYVGSFSKILAPALRLGWMVAPQQLVPRLTVVKEAGDLESSALMQRAVAAYLDSGKLGAHIEELRSVYGRRRDAMLAAMSQYFPPNVQWTEPNGGMFIWVKLPPQIDATELLEYAVEREKIAFIPGRAFAVAGTEAGDTMRLNFTNCSAERIEDGIGRLGRAISTFL